MEELFWNRMIFEGISESSRQAIEDMPKKECYYKANELVTNAGDPIDSICIILSGVLKSTEYTSEGKELNSSYYFEGDAFPFYLVYGGTKTNFSDTYAMKKSRVVWLKVKDLIPVIDRDQVFLQNILRFVAEYCCYSKLIIRCTQYRRVIDRLCFWMLYIKNPDEWIEIPKSQEVLADILHVSRCNLNQELKYLHKNGIIEIENKKIKVLDKEFLYSML